MGALQLGGVRGRTSGLGEVMGPLLEPEEKKTQEPSLWLFVGESPGPGGLLIGTCNFCSHIPPTCFCPPLHAQRLHFAGFCASAHWQCHSCLSRESPPSPFLVLSVQEPSCGSRGNALLVAASWNSPISLTIGSVDLWVNLVAQTLGKESTCNAGDGFDPWVGKIPWRREWQPTSVYLPGEFHGQRSLAGYGPWGCKELDTTEAQHSTAHLWDLKW